jgi:hypothetical protein
MRGDGAADALAFENLLAFTLLGMVGSGKSVFTQSASSIQKAIGSPAVMGYYTSAVQCAPPAGTS